MLILLLRVIRAVRTTLLVADVSSKLIDRHVPTSRLGIKVGEVRDLFDTDEGINCRKLRRDAIIRMDVELHRLQLSRSARAKRAVIVFFISVALVTVVLCVGIGAESPLDLLSILGLIYGVPIFVLSGGLILLIRFATKTADEKAALAEISRLKAEGVRPRM